MLKTMAPKMGPRMKGIWLGSLELVVELTLAFKVVVPLWATLGFVSVEALMLDAPTTR